jgi:hypothetical protein
LQALAHRSLDFTPPDPQQPNSDQLGRRDQTASSGEIAWAD